MKKRERMINNNRSENMKGLKSSVFVITLVFLLIGTIVNTYSASQESKIKRLFARFQAGWNSKDFNKINSCLYEPNQKQTEAYVVIGEYIKDIRMNVKVLETKVSGNLARATVSITRKIKVQVREKGVEKPFDTEEENITYLLFKDGRNWKIVGLLDKNIVLKSKLSSRPVTSDNIDDFLARYNSLSDEEKKKVISDGLELEKTGKAVSWLPIRNAVVYEVALYSKNPFGKSPGNELLFSQKALKQSTVTIPDEVYEILEKGRPYFFIVSGYDTDMNKRGEYLLKIKRGGENE